MDEFLTWCLINDLDPDCDDNHEAWELEFDNNYPDPDAEQDLANDIKWDI